MKKIIPLRLFVMLIVTAFIFSQCKKGENGAAGATGPAGPQGPAGSTGSTGPKGDTGTANVIYSAWLDVTFAPDTSRRTTGKLDTIGWFSNITAAKLTQAILTNGDMKVYINLGTPTAPVVAPLPYYDVYTDISILPQFSLNRIFLYSDLNVSTYTASNVKRQQYRYVLIPGGTPGVAAGSKAVDLNNYEAVKNYYNIPD